MGISDVDRLANSLTKDQLEDWRAVAVLDGWENGYSQQSEVLAAIHNATNRIELALQRTPEAIRATARRQIIKTGWGYIKDRFRFGKPRRPRGMATPEQALKQLSRK